MQENDLGTCLNCGEVTSENHEWYCSGECKAENKSPRTKHNGPSWYQMARCEEVTGVPISEQE